MCEFWGTSSEMPSKYWKTFLRFNLIYFYVCHYMHLWVCARECGYPQRPAEGAESSRAGVKGGCELLNWSAGHQTQVLCKINNHSKIGPIKASSFWDTNQWNYAGESSHLSAEPIQLDKLCSLWILFYTPSPHKQKSHMFSIWMFC